MCFRTKARWCCYLHAEGDGEGDAFFECGMASPQAPPQKVQRLNLAGPHSCNEDFHDGNADDDGSDLEFEDSLYSYKEQIENIAAHVRVWSRVSHEHSLSRFSNSIRLGKAHPGKVEVERVASVDAAFCITGGCTPRSNPEQDS